MNSIASVWSYGGRFTDESTTITEAVRGRPIGRDVTIPRFTATRAASKRERLLASVQIQEQEKLARETATEVQIQRPERKRRANAACITVARQESSHTALPSLPTRRMEVIRGSGRRIFIPTIQGTLPPILDKLLPFLREPKNDGSPWPNWNNARTGMLVRVYGEYPMQEAPTSCCNGRTR